VYNFDFKTRKEHNEERRREHLDRQARGGDPPSVPAGLRGKASAEEVERWTTYKPAKPPGRA
jgi:hypothetical protein